MPTLRTPRGVTPPAPGLEREEPTYVPEKDIPDNENRANARGERGKHEEGPGPERE